MRHPLHILRVRFGIINRFDSILEQKHFTDVASKRKHNNFNCLFKHTTACYCKREEYFKIEKIDI